MLRHVLQGPFDLKKILLWICAGLLGLMLSLQVHAQAPTISYPIAAANLTRGYSNSSLTVKLVFNGACTGATTVKIALPPNVNYVGSTVSKTGGTAGLSISELSISDLRNPVFNISGISAIGDDITFTIARRALCGSSTTAKDSVYVFTSGSCSNASELVGTVNVYNILSPAFSLTPPAALTGALIGTTATRSLSVANGGLGATDTVRFYIVYPNVGIVNTSGTNAIVANGSSFTPSATSGDTLFYKVYGATLFGGNNLFENGEVVTIQEPIKVVKCNTATTYNASWGNNSANICQSISANSSMTMQSGTPGPSGSISVVQSSGTCRKGIYNLTFTNTGSGGIAGALYNVVQRVGYTAGSNLNNISATDIRKVDSVKFGIGGPDILFASTVGAPYLVNMSQFTSDPDGAGVGLDDLDGDGQYDDLGPGKSYTLQIFDYWYCGSSCPFTDNFKAFNAQANYTTMCGGASLTTNTFSSATANGQTGFQPLSSITAPSTISGGTTFTVNFCLGGAYSVPSYKPFDTSYLSVVLPSGISISGATGNAAFNGGLVAASGVKIHAGSSSAPDTLVVAIKGLASGCFTIDFVYTCSGLGTIEFFLASSAKYVSDTSCSCGTLPIYCNQNTRIKAFCGAICSSGIANLPPNIERTTLGWTDSSLTTRLSPGAVSGMARATAMAYDSISVHASGLQFGTYNNLYFDMQLDKSLSNNVLSWVGGTLFIKRGASTSSCALTSPTDLSSATLQKYQWDLSSCLASGTAMPSDSFWVDLKFTVANVAMYHGDTLTRAGNAYAYFYNKNISSVPEFCDSFASDLYLVENKLRGSSSVNTVNACTSMDVLSLLQGRHSMPYDIFPNEFRPIYIVDSAAFTIPSGFALDLTSSNFVYQIDRYSTPYALILRTIPYTYTLSGNVLKSGPFIASDYSAFANPLTWTVPLKPICGTTGTTAPSAVVTYYIRQYAYVPSASTALAYTPSSLATGFIYSLSNKPNVDLADNTGIVQGVQRQHYWDVQVNSDGTATAPYIWLAAEKGLGSGGIAVDSVVLLPSHTLLSVAGTYNGTDKWYQMSASGLASGTNQQLRVYFTYSSCSKDSLLLKSGWSCVAYPSPDPRSYECVVAQTYLKVAPLTSQVQVSISRQPGGGSAISLCATDSMLLVVNSAQAANLINPYLEIYPPAGITLASTMAVEYPLGSGDYQTLPLSSIGSGAYKIDLTAHTAIGVNGVLGTELGSASFVPAGGDRQVKIKLDFSTDCSFTSGSSIPFAVFGNRPCGQFALGNGSKGTSAAINIVGATTVGSAGASFSFSPSSISCGTSLPISLTTTPTTVGTSVGDTVVYTLPQGLSYAGAFVKGANCSTCEINSVSGAGGITIVKVKLQTGVAAGTALDYGFDVKPAGGGCGTVNISAVYKRDIPALTCGVTVCTGSSVVIASASSPDITLNKPDLQLTAMHLVDTSIWVAGGFVNKVWVQYSNTGTQNYTANADSVEFFCGSSTTAFATLPLTKNIIIGASDSDFYNIVIPSGSACSIGDLVTAKIQTKTSAGSDQCLCNSSSFLLAGAPLPLKFLSVKAKANHCAVQLDWQYNESETHLNAFEIERRDDAGMYKSITSLTASTSQYIDLTPASSQWFYRIKATDINGKNNYSATVSVQTDQCLQQSLSVYPNPANQKIQLLLQGNSQSAAYEILNALGRIVLKGTLQTNVRNDIDVSFIPAEVYIIKVTTASSVITKQIQIIR